VMNTGSSGIVGANTGVRVSFLLLRPFFIQVVMIRYTHLIFYCSTIHSLSFQGEMGFVRVKTGSNLLGIESTVAWATLGTFTTDNNYPCGEGGAGCGGEEGDTNGPHRTHYYVDPSADVEAVQRKLKEGGHIMV